MNNLFEKKKLMAEFMGLRPKMEAPDVYTFSDMPWFSIRKNNPEEVMNAIVKYSKYDTDYNWLMGVVDKIESMSYSIGRHFVLRTESAYVQFIVDRMNVQPFGKWGTCGGGENKKIAILNACCEFIEAYNKLKKLKKDDALIIKNFTIVKII